MFTIIDMNTAKTKNRAKLLEMKNYRLPKGKREVLPVIYQPVPRGKEQVGFDIYDYNMLFNDYATKKMMREGNTLGCFYIESPGMRSLLRRLECDTFEMLTAASSVIRPGVAESGMMQEFIARHKDPSRRKYLVPEMENYLGETYGVMIYQEDVIKVAHHIAGLSLEEADLLRRAMSGKMRSKDAMKALAEKFNYSCKKKGFSDRITHELWRQIESFAGYAFCKAHSASFALLSFQVAYLKAHYPAEFMASVISNGGGYYSKAVYIWECKRLGLNVLLPSVNDSGYEYSGGEGKIQMGLMAVKNLSRKAAEAVVANRKSVGKYMSLADFIVRTRIGYEDTVLLIKCGAMDCFNQTRPTLMRLVDLYFHHRKILNEFENDLFTREMFRLEEEVVTDRNYSVEEVSAIEYESFGFMVTRHPLQFFEGVINRRTIIKAAEMYKHDGKTIKMVGWFMTSKRIKTKKGDIMKFLSLEDLTGTFEAVLFPQVYAQYAEMTMSMGPYLLKGKVDMETGNNLVVEKLAVLSAKEVKGTKAWDSAENKYYGDSESVHEEEFAIVSSLNTEKLKKAYSGK